MPGRTHGRGYNNIPAFSSPENRRNNHRKATSTTLDPNANKTAVFFVCACVCVFFPTARNAASEITLHAKFAFNATPITAER